MPLVGQKIETSSDNFAYMVRHNCLLVDKTLMNKDFLLGKNVSLILRPRRSGKSLNMSMLQHFFAAEVAGEKTAGLFDHFAIAREDNGQFLAEHQGKYPVIAISFKDSKQTSYADMLRNIAGLIEELYREHENLLSSGLISISMKERYQKYLTGSASREDLEQSLKFLSEFLYKTHGKNPMIFIDEYDTPLTHAYQYEFLNELGSFLRNMLSSALKGNPYLEKGLMTGILRVSKNELLSGLNNIKIYSIFDRHYSTYYGFTELEVAELVERIGISNSLEEIRLFYNGYLVGDTLIYNPWSMMHYLEEQRLAPYWVFTSNDQLLKKLLLKTDSNKKQQLTDLMQGKTITATISLQTRYEELMEESDALWTLLLFTGYLTVVNKTEPMGKLLCQLKIPNNEILTQYQTIFSDWLAKNLGGETQYYAFMKSLLEGNVEKFTTALGHYLMDALSYRDVRGDKKAEIFYHGFVAALVASVRDTHWVDSNKESGRGLYDVMLTPKSSQYHRALILEFKHVKKTESLDAMAEAALAQIERLDYMTVLERYPHVIQVLKVGLAFSGKEVRSVYKETNFLTKQEGELIWTETQYREETE